MREDVGADPGVGYNADVAAEIRAALAKRRWSQVRLAESLGVSEMWVSNRIGRCTVRLDLDDIERIAGVLDLDVLALLKASA